MRLLIYKWPGCYKHPGRKRELEVAKVGRTLTLNIVKQTKGSSQLGELLYGLNACFPCQLPASRVHRLAGKLTVVRTPAEVAGTGIRGKEDARTVEYTAASSSLFSLGASNKLITPVVASSSLAVVGCSAGQQKPMFNSRLLALNGISNNNISTVELATKHLIASYSTMRELLQPTHEYFRDKWGWLREFREYKLAADAAGSVYYPVVTYDCRSAKLNNPYRKYELSRSHSGRTIEQLAGVIEANKLTDVRLAEPTYTIPADISAALAAMGDKGRRVEWAAFTKVLNIDLPMICGITGELAVLANMHTWSTKIPVKPHYHIHAAILNYVVGLDGKLVKWFGTGLGKLYHDKNGNVRSGPVAVSYVELEKLGIAWANRLRAGCRRAGIPLDSIPDSLNVWFNPAPRWDTPDGRPRFIHWINYMRRSPIEDYAKYSNDNTGCPAPPEFITGYRNISRAFGWWKRLKQYGGEVKKVNAGDIKKISPLTGEAMVYVGKVSVPGVLAAGGLHSFDMVKGVPVVTLLDDSALNWVKTVSVAGRAQEEDEVFAALDEAFGKKVLMEVNKAERLPGLEENK